MIEHSVNEAGVEGKFCIGFNSGIHWCPLEDFWHDDSRKDGLADRCKLCYKEYAQSDRGKKSKAKRAKRYEKSDKGKKCRRKYLQSEKGKITQHNNRVIREIECITYLILSVTMSGMIN